MSPADLPPVNAFLNGLSAVLLYIGWTRIKRGDQEAHRRFMVAAFISSSLFLACYLTYHGYNTLYLKKGPTRFVDPAWFRPVYLIILLTHTVIAMAVLPLAIGTLWLGLKQRYEAHRRIARWTWPLWMYVSVTGVLIYLLLYQVFPQERVNPSGPAGHPASALPVHNPRS